MQQMSYDTGRSQERQDNENSEDDADSENDTLYTNNKKNTNPKSTKNNEDDEGEIWLFRKKAQPQEKPGQQAPDEFAKSLQKLKLRKRQEREKRRNAEEKDFSDQDEPDRDVTTVLDIAKLKRLPKLL